MYRVLIADDSIYARDSLKDILLKAGYDVVGEACNGLEVIELYQKLTPDIVTMDITMPQINGIEALKKIIKINKEAKVIMMTAVGRPDKTIEALDNGALGYVIKPFDEDVVLKAINLAMGTA